MTPKDASGFLVFVRQAQRQFKTQRAFARAVGITESRYSRVLRGDAGAFRVDNCLRLAKILRRTPSEILRSAGPRNTRIADLLDDLYRPSLLDALRIDDEEMAALWRELDEDDRELLRSNARRYRSQRQPTPPKNRAKKRR